MRNFYEREIQRVVYCNKRRDIRKREGRDKKPAPEEDHAVNHEEEKAKHAQEELERLAKAEDAAEATYQKILRTCKEQLKDVVVEQKKHHPHASPTNASHATSPKASP